MRSTPWCVSRAAPHYPCVARARPQAFGRPAALDAADAEQKPSLPRPTGTTGQRRPASSRSWCSPMRAPSQQRFNCREGRERRSPDATGRAASPRSAAKPTAGLRGLMAATAPVSGPTEVMARDVGLSRRVTGRTGGAASQVRRTSARRGCWAGLSRKPRWIAKGRMIRGAGLRRSKGPQTPVNGHKILGQRRLHASDAALYSHRTTGGTASGRIPPRDRDAGAAYGPASRTIAARKV